MPTVTINAVDYDVLADAGAADAYLAADFGATEWRAETDADQKARALVTATRLLNTVLCVDGTTLPEVASADVPDAIVNGSIVLAKLIHAGSTVASSDNGDESNVKRQQAGSVSIEYFSPAIFADTGRWPVELLDLVGGYFCSGSGVAGAASFGTCGESIVCRGFETGWEAP